MHCPSFGSVHTDRLSGWANKVEKFTWYVNDTLFIIHLSPGANDDGSMVLPVRSCGVPAKLPHNPQKVEMRITDKTITH